MSEDSSGLLVVRGKAGKETTVKFDVDDDYRLLQTIGTGAYGIVCSAIHKATGQKVAIKKISSPFDILTTAKRTLRELKLLLHFKHDNIVAVKNILYHESDDHKVKDVYVVMDLMESDLHHIIRSQQSLTENHICYFIYQLLRGLKYIHSANVIHRDLKPSNLLVNENCELKIGDFGMARGVANSPEDNRNFMTEYVATRWYRAPELMLSMSEYSMAIDMWSVGCIFAEMIGRKQLFPGRHYVHQLQLIISVLGSPSAKLVNSIRSERVRSYVRSLPKKKPVPFKALYPKASDSVIDLLSSFLQFDPTCRESAESSLKHPFFREYHDRDDEPNCPTPFDFRFETLPVDGAGPTKDSVKKQVIDVINDYHSKLNRLKQQLVYLPKSANKFAFPETNVINSAVQDTNINISKPLDQDIFKKPTLIPTNKSSVKSNKLKNQASQPISSNVEMLSAKSDVSKLDQNESTEALSDVVMLSAKSSTTEAKKDVDKINDHQPNLESNKSKAPTGKLDGNNNKAKKTISETTKMLVRDTILASMLAKKNGLTKPPEKPKKPITAAERQREREEKRRKRQEKAAEKERKKKEAQGSKPTLSEQDKGLLERWSKMQAQAKKHIAPTVAAVQKAAILSPNTLTRQNSLPSLITPNIAAESNPEPITPRRWSLNSDVSYDDGNNFRYVPTLSDIPPSPMVANETQLYAQSNQGQPHLNDSIITKQNPAFGNIPNHGQNPVQQSQPQIIIQQFGTELNSQHALHIQKEPQEFQNNGSSYADASSVSQSMLQRPDTLRVADFQQTLTTGSQNSDTGMISSAKSLVNLSPDTVDFVLNHQIQNPPNQPGERENFERRTSTEDVLTLSPGKTSLIVKSIAAYNAQQKSASIEFSPQSFLLEMDKITQKSDQYLNVDQTSNEGKFFDSRNGSVMLSESAVSNRNEMLYVNSNLTHNPLRQSSDGNGQANGTFNQGMVGGYGIGYEPEVHGPVFDSENKVHVNLQNQHYEMECESAKSSSSLLNDWLEVSRMGEHDIEQLQRELELGSPMCIDTYNFKPD